MTIKVRISMLSSISSVTALIIAIDLFFVQSSLVVATPPKAPVDETEFEADPTLWSSISSNGTIEDRQRIINKLLNEKPGYDATNYPTNFTVQFGVSLLSLTLDALPRPNVFQASVLTHTLWTDPRLQWDASEYGGHSLISLPSNLVWKPSIRLLNSASAPSVDDCADANVLVASNGQVLWTTPCQYLAHCDLTGDWNANKTCVLVFGSWVSSAAGASMDLQFYKNIPDFDPTFFNPSPEINIIASKAVRVEKLEQSHSEMFPVQLIFAVEFARRADDFGGCNSPGGACPGLGHVDPAACNEGEKLGPDGTCVPAAEF